MNHSNSTITTEAWFIPLNILSMICLTIVIALATFCLLVIIFDRTCHTVPMILIANSCLSTQTVAVCVLWMDVFTLRNDLEKSQYPDSLCIFRGYLTYVLCASQNYTYLLQAIYRYITIIYRTHLFWKSARVQAALIGTMWIFTFVFPIVFLWMGKIVYNVDNQICQISLGLSFSIIFAALCVYIIPVLTIMFVYLKIIEYVKAMSQRVTPVNTLLRAQRELTMVRRTIIVVVILLTIIFPYALFILISFFTTPPKYHFRIAYFFVKASLLAVMIALYQFTDTLKAAIKKIRNGRPNLVVPVLT